VALTEFLATKGQIDPNLPAMDGGTMLHAAVTHGLSPAKISDLLSIRGVEVDRQDIEGFTPLMRAVVQKDLAGIKVLIERGKADPNFTNRSCFPRTWVQAMEALMLNPHMSGKEAARHNQVFKHIRARTGADPGSREELRKALESSYCASAVHLAASMGLEEEMKYLIESTTANVSLRFVFVSLSFFLSFFFPCIRPNFTLRSLCGCLSFRWRRF
jgi:ankyrin repeat protein